MLLTAVLFTACDQENLDTLVPSDPQYQPEVVDVNPLMYSLQANSSDELIISCLTIPLPIDLLQQSGSIITVSTQEELDDALMLPDSIADFVYPFGAVVGMDVIVIESIEDLGQAIIECSTVPFDCVQDVDAHVLLFYNALNIFTLNRYVYDINYPVSLIVEGTQVVINNDDEYLPAIGGNPSQFLEVELIYPITITQFGRDIVLNNDSDVCDFNSTLDEACENKPAHIQFFFNGGPGTPINCAYFINYPLEIMLNGTTIEVATREDYLNELNASPDAYDNITLVYPVTATTFIDGEQLNFEVEADICQYLGNCQ